MTKFEQTIDVNVPVRNVYNQWTQFEHFPEFMEGVEEVRQLTPDTLFWRAEIAGSTQEWHAEITEQIPDKRIAWNSTEGATNAGIVIFDPLDESRTRIMLQIEYDPEGFVENVGAALGIVESRMQGDLKRFKSFIEERGVPTGAWRGVIERDDPTIGL